MKKKVLVPVIMALLAVLVIAVSAISCGKQTGEEANATEPETTVEETTVPETTAEETTEAETTAEETTVPETTEAVETAEAETAAPAAETGQAKTETKASTNSTKTETKAPAPTQAAAPAPAQAAAPAPAPAPAKPAHEHTWKDHAATKTEWVPNMVEVQDYETKTYTVRVCNCGQVNPDREHKANHALNGEDTGEWTETRTETVPAGTHIEDHGYNNTVEYVDYQYCDCGATR